MPDIYSKGGTVDYGDGFYVEDLTAKRNLRSFINQPPPDPPKPEPAKKQKPPAKKKKSGCGCLISMLLILLAILLIAVGVYMILVLSRVHYTNDNVTHNPNIKTVSKSGIVNTLIIGEDNHKENEHGRADTIILLTVDKNTKQMKLTSFMRDLYINIPGHGYDKLNSSYAYGGAALTAQTIENNFRIQIDHYIVVDFNSFTAMVDAAGGLDLQLERSEIEYINMQSYRNKQTSETSELDPDGYAYDSDGLAKVHLNGRQSLWYARDRDSAGSDFDRTKRQRTVIFTLMSQLSGKLHMTLPVGYALAPYLTTNMNPLELSGRGLDYLMAVGYQQTEHRSPMSNNYYDDWNDSGQVLCIYDVEYEIEELHHFVFE